MESTQPITCFYYPSTVIVVDDSEAFLKKMSLGLNNRLSYLLFSEASQAINYLKNQSEQPLLLQLMKEDTESEDYQLQSSKHQTKIDLSTLYHKVYDSNRFNEVSVVLVDYSMPSMDGEKFCRALSSSHVKKIMLTGQADNSLAVNLFNSGLIDNFLKKESNEMGAMVDDMIASQQKNYFYAQNKTLVDNLNTQSDFHLGNFTIQKIFKDFCEKHDIVEYYFIRPNGSCLLLDFNGLPYWFVVADEDELKEFSQIAEDGEAAPNIVDDLQEGKQLPFFPAQRELMNIDDKKWEAYLYPCQQTTSNGKTYYYAFVKDRDLLPLDRDQIVSFSHYLDKVWKPFLDEK